MAAAFERAIARLRAAGFDVLPLDLDDMLATLNDSSRVVMAYEAARVHEQRYREHGELLQHLADLVRLGQAIQSADYERALRHIADCRRRMSVRYEATPVILVPSATGPAPVGLVSTGDPRMNAPWTALGTPAVSIPMGTDIGLPLGLQITANRDDDARVLRMAVRVEEMLST
jgi:Asp-tRNA(Asn)/Glu-tRNA(Gln) amidotransferase A subunit family amidase